MAIIQHRLLTRSRGVQPQPPGPPQPPAPLLPSGYKPVEYITFTGTQYIDPNYTVSASDKPLWVEVDFRLTSTAVESSVFGTMAGNSQNPLVIDTDIQQQRWRFGHFGNSSTSGISAFVRFGTLDTNWHTVRYVFNEGVYFDGVLVPETVEQAGIVSVSGCKLYIGATSMLNVQANKKASMELSAAQIGEASGAVRKFCASYREADGVIGLYDLCNSVDPRSATPLYINAGSGEFVKGADI